MVEARCPGNLDEPEIYGPAGVEPSAVRGGTARCRGRAAGYQTRMRWNDPSDWVWSTEQTHEAIVSSEDFSRAQAQMAAGAHRPFTAKGHRTKRTYMLLSGLVTCGLCTRKMQGSYNHDARVRAGPTPGTTHETADPRGRIEPRHIASVLATADPKLKAEVYAELGISVTFDPVTRMVAAESRPEGACRAHRVGGPTGNFGPRPVVMESPWSELRTAA